MGGLKTETRTSKVHMKKQVRNGISVRRLNLLLGGIAVVLAAILVFSTIRVLYSYRETEVATDRYIKAQQSAAAMRSGSDYLTDRVRTFVITGDPQAAADFFEEIEVTKRRDRALEDMETLFVDEEEIALMNEALWLSNKLTEIESYAMRLTVESRGYAISAYPVLQDIELSETDRSMSKEEQREKAYLLVFDETYQSFKSEIRENISECEQTLVGKTYQAQASNAEQLGRLLVLESVLIGVLLLTVSAIVACTHQLVLAPLRTVIGMIPSKGMIPEIGSQELRYMVHAYNDAYQKSKEHQDQLIYQATHDHLTGLLNRAVFEEQRVNTHKRRQAMLLIDVDHFKQINDTYGHETGDRVLKKVADILQKSFRSEDHICRIGGDEFAVILQHVDRTMREVIEKKLDRILAALRDVSDGLPPVSLCIGVAFCDSLNPTDDLYKDADAAMYRVKGHGKNGYAFFEDPAADPADLD